MRWWATNMMGNHPPPPVLAATQAHHNRCCRVVHSMFTPGSSLDVLAVVTVGCDSERLFVCCWFVRRSPLLSRPSL